MEVAVLEVTQTYSLFSEDVQEFTDEENDSIRLCCDLFRHVSTSAEPLSNSQQYRRIRARNFLKDVYHKVGPEVFVLCMLTWPITTLGKFKSKIILPKLLQWWESVPTKEGLRSTADKICKDNGIKELVEQVKTFAASSKNKKRTRLSKTRADKTVSQDQHSRPDQPDTIPTNGSLSQTSAQVNEGQSLGPLALKVDDIPELHVFLLSDQHPQSVFELQIAQLMAFLHRYHLTSSNPDQLARILRLLEEYQSICPHIQLVYPWYGTLPTIDIKVDSKVGWSAKVQLSHRLADELIGYIRGFSLVDAGSVGHRGSQ